MSNSVRLFIAIRIVPSKPLRKMVSRLSVLGNAVRAMDVDNLHLTLKFLGDSTLELVPQINSAIEEAVSHRSAFLLPLIGLGAFPHARRPTVIWAGSPATGPVMEIAAALEQQLEMLGYRPERRAYHPHVTLARVRSKPPDELAELLEQNASTDFGTADVHSVELYQSELRPEGPRYTVLSRVELGGE
jgi:2'-5' RNA ligase